MNINCMLTHTADYNNSKFGVAEKFGNTVLGGFNAYLLRMSDGSGYIFAKNYNHSVQCGDYMYYEKDALDAALKEIDDAYDPYNDLAQLQLAFHYASHNDDDDDDNF